MAPVLIELPALMATFLLVLVLIMLSFAYRSTIGLLLQQLAHLFYAINIHVPWVGSLGLSSVGDAIVAMDNTIRHAFGVTIEANKHAFVAVFHFTGQTLQATGRAIDYLAGETEHALRIAVRSTVPLLIAAALGPLWLAIKALQAATHGLTQTLPRIQHTVTRTITHEITRVQRQVLPVQRVIVQKATTAVAAAGAIALPRIGGLERKVSRLETWVKAHARGITAAGVLGLTGVALSRLGLGWTRCSKVGRLGKAVCGMDEGLLESLLAGALVVAGSISIVELARECQAFTGEVDAATRFFVRELH
jgi:hypothetical protein